MEKVFLNNETAVAQNKWNVGKIVYGMCCRSRDETWHKDVSKANALQRKLKKNREPKTKTNKKKIRRDCTLYRRKENHWNSFPTCLLVVIIVFDNW